MKKYIYTILFILIGIGIFNTAKAIDQKVIEFTGTPTSLTGNPIYNGTVTDIYGLACMTESAGQTMILTLTDNTTGATSTGSTALSNTGMLCDGGTGRSQYVTIAMNPQLTVDIYHTYTLSVQMTGGGGGLNVPVEAQYNPNESIRLNFKYPIDSTSFPYDFTHFQIYANNPETNIVQGASLEILLDDNSNFTSPQIYSDYQTHILQPNTTTTIDIQKINAITQSGLYYAKVKSLGSNASTTISFNVSNPIATTYTGTPLYEGTPYNEEDIYNGLVATSSPFFVDCSAYNTDNFFSSSTLPALWCLTRKVFSETTGWFVTPPTWSIDYIKTRMTNMKQAFPFSLVYGTIGGIQTALTQTESSQPLNLDLPQIGLNTNILTSQTLENEIGTSTKTLFDTTVKNVIWIFAGIAALIIITI